MRRMKSHGPSAPRHHRRGSYNVLTALMFPVISAMLAGAVDTWTIYSAQAHLQRAADAAALAGATSATNDSEAKSRADETSVYNALGSHVTLVKVALATGVYKHGVYTNATDNQNAVRVTAEAQVALTFGPLIGIDTAPIGVDAVAWYFAYDCDIFVDSYADFWGSMEGDGWDSCKEGGSYSGGTEEASLCTNGTAALRGSVTYDGDINSGTDGDVIVGGSATYSGSSTDLSYAIELPSLKTDADVKSAYNDNHEFGFPKNLVLTGDRVVNMGPGVFYFQSILITGTVQLALQCPVEVWIDGPGGLDLYGDASITTAAGCSAEDVTIYMVGDTPSVLKGTVDLNGSLIAPEADVKIQGTATIYGAVMADTLAVSGSAAFHTDTCLTMEDYGVIWEDQDMAPVLVNAIVAP